MFSLIITIVSIVLVAALAAATIYFGGDRYTEWKTQSEASELANEANQILTAIETYHRVDHDRKDIEELEDLTPEYLSSVPEGWTLDWDEMVIYIDDSHFSEAACYQVNEEIGYNEQFGEDLEEGEAPSCDDDGINEFPFVCCF